MKIEYECKIAQDGYEWRTVTEGDKKLVFIKAKTKKIKTAPLPDNAYTETCKLGWALQQKGAEPHELIMAHVEKYGSLRGIEGHSKLVYRTFVASYLEYPDGFSGPDGFSFPYPSVKSYSDFAISLYEQRKDMKMGLPDMAIEQNLDLDVSDQMTIAKRRVGNKIELFVKPYLLSTAIDLQFVMYQGMVGHYKVCEICSKPFTSSRSDAKCCPDTSTCKVTKHRNKNKKGAKK